MSRAFLSGGETRAFFASLETLFDMLLMSRFAIIDKIFETNSSFDVKYSTTEKVQFSFYGSFFIVLKKKIILGIRLGIRP